MVRIVRLGAMATSTGPMLRGPAGVARKSLRVMSHKNRLNKSVLREFEFGFQADVGGGGSDLRFVLSGLDYPLHFPVPDCEQVGDDLEFYGFRFAWFQVNSDRKNVV